MKVKVLRNLGRGLPNYSENQIVDVKDEEAGELIASGLAIAVDSKGKPKEIKAVPPAGPVIEGES